MVFRIAMELGGAVAVLKQLKTFGMSYLHPVFIKIGIIGMYHVGSVHERTEFADFKAVKQKEAGYGHLSDLDNA